MNKRLGLGNAVRMRFDIIDSWLFRRLSSRKEKIKNKNLAEDDLCRISNHGLKRAKNELKTQPYHCMKPYTTALQRAAALM